MGSAPDKPYAWQKSEGMDFMIELDDFRWENLGSMVTGWVPKWLKCFKSLQGAFADIADTVSDFVDDATDAVANGIHSHSPLTSSQMQGLCDEDVTQPVDYTGEQPGTPDCQSTPGQGSRSGAGAWQRQCSPGRSANGSATVSTLSREERELELEMERENRLKHFMPTDGIAQFTKIHIHEVSTTLKCAARKAIPPAVTKSLTVVSTNGFVENQVIIIGAGTKQEEVNKVHLIMSSHSATTGAALKKTLKVVDRLRGVNIQLAYPLKYDHDQGDTVAVEDDHWVCIANKCMTLNKHSMVKCHKCKEDRPKEIEEEDMVLMELRNQLRERYGRMMLKRLKAEDFKLRRYKHICVCGNLMRPNALFCKECGKLQHLECPTPECPNLHLSPDRMCHCCRKKPDKDTLQLANFAQRVFRHKAVMERIDSEINKVNTGKHKSLWSIEELKDARDKGILPNDMNPPAKRKGPLGRTIRPVLTYEEFAEGLRGILKEVWSPHPIALPEDKLRILYDKAHETAMKINGRGLDSKAFTSVLFRLLPFLRAGEDEVESFREYQQASAQAAVPWCPDHDEPVRSCQFCHTERQVLAALLDAKKPLPPRPRRPGRRPVSPGVQQPLVQPGQVDDVELQLQRPPPRAPTSPDDIDPMEEPLDEETKKKTLEKTKAKTIQEKKELYEMTRIQNQGVWPWFIWAQSILAAAVWFYWALVNSGDDWTNALAGLDNFFDPGFTTLRTHYNCIDLRGQIWRYWSYQWTHYKLGHISANCIMNIFLGLRLNKLNGNAYMAWFWTLGVLGGAGVYCLVDVHKTTIGMSGGTYSLFGQRYAYLALNFKQKRYALTEFIFLTCMLGVDFVIWWTSLKKDDPEATTKVSQAAHVGGGVMGIMVVLMFGVNLETDVYERYIQIVTYFVFVLFWGFIIIFRLTAWAPWDFQNTDGYCWLQLVYNRSVFNDTKWHCIQCEERTETGENIFGMGGDDVLHGCPQYWVATQKWRANVTWNDCLNDKTLGKFCEVTKDGGVGHCWTV